MISLMLLLYQLSAGIGSVLPISNNLPFPSPQLIWTFYWYNCCFLSYSSFKGHWRVNLQVSSLPCYYSETSICESHLNSQNKTTQLFTLLIKENKAKVSQPVNQQPLDWIWAGSIQTKASLFYTCLEPSNPRTATLNNLIKSKLSILWTTPWAIPHNCIPGDTIWLMLRSVDQVLKKTLKHLRPLSKKNAIKYQ